MALLVVFAGLPGSGKSTLARGVAALYHVVADAVNGVGPGMPGHDVPTWEQVRRRRYEPWPPELPGRLVIDNIGDAAANTARVVAELAGSRSDAD